MKAPAFWYQPPGFLARLLAPLSQFYLGVVAAERKKASPYRAKVPVICIGNVVAGGAGKTPTALGIAEILKQAGANPVFVTRGYGGSERGPLRVDPARHTAADVGDEALLLARSAPTWVGSDRAATVKAAETEATHIILDDGLQNPHLNPHLSFLVVDGESGLGNGCVMPAGPLREPLADALKRVAAVVLIGDHDMQNIAARVKIPVLRAKIEPALSPDFPKMQVFLAFAGIGRPEKFYTTCRKAGLNVVDTIDFPDHHAFTGNDFVLLQGRAARRNARLVTTEKDWVRLPEAMQKKVAAMPVTLVFENTDEVSRLLQSSAITAPRAPS